MRLTARPGGSNRRQGDPASRLAQQVASRCLCYPDEELLQQLPRLRAGVAGLAPGVPREELGAFLDEVSRKPLQALQLAYVEVFDMTGKRSLYLSYWTDGDTRRRGAVLGEFKQRYRNSGFLVDTHGELTDFLPLVLEYAAIADPVDGPALLQEYRASIELLRFALEETHRGYAGVLRAVCATLPGPSPADRAAVHRMAAAGPPKESVGLDPYDPRLLPLADEAPGQAPRQKASR